MDKTYMKYMTQGSGTDYKEKHAPNKTKEPKPFHGDGGGLDDGPVTEGKEEYDNYVKMMLKKKGIENLGDLSDEETKAFFAEIDKGYKAKNEELEFLQMGIDAIDVIENLLGEYDEVSRKTLVKLANVDENIDYGNKGLNSGYLRTEMRMAYDSNNYDALIESYNNVKEYPKADAKGGSKTEYPVKNKPEKKKKPKDGWQGDDGGVSDVVEALELFNAIFDLSEVKVVTKDTIAKKKAELAAASAAMRKQHAGSVGFDKRAEKKHGGRYGDESGKRQLAKVKRAKERKKRGLTGRTGVYTAGQGKVKSPKIIGGQRVKSDAKKKGLSGQETDAFKKEKTQTAKNVKRQKTTKKAKAYYKGRKEANKATELKNMGKEGVKKKESKERKLKKKQDYDAAKKAGMV